MEKIKNSPLVSDFEGPNSNKCLGRSAATYDIATLLVGPNFRSVVKVVYSDESGTGSIKEEPLTVVVAYLVNVDEGWSALESALLPLARRCHRELQLNEMKGSALFKEIRRQKSRAASADEILRAILGVARDRLLPIFYAAVHRQHFEERKTGLMGWHLTAHDTPFRVALRSCLEQVDTYVETWCPREKVLWIADDASYNEHSGRREIASSQNWARWGISKFFLGKQRARTSHLADTIYFGPSVDSVAVQLADVCCSTIANYLQSKWMGRGQQTKGYYEIIRPRIVGDETPPLFM